MTGIIVQRWCATTLLLFCALASVDRARSADLVSADDRLVVFRDFSDIVISEQQLGSVRAFFDPGPPSAHSLSSSEPFKEIATDLLKSRIKLVSQKSDANLLIQTRMYQTIDFATRNPNGRASRGNIMISVCKYPIQAIKIDCENLTYYFFADYKAEDIFRSVFAKWLDTVLPDKIK